MVRAAMAGPGSAVLLPAPWYFNHHMTLTMQGIDSVALPCAAEAGFVPDPERAAALITPATRAIVLVSPNNPTGAVYPPDIIPRFGALCRRRGLWLAPARPYPRLVPRRA